MEGEEWPCLRQRTTAGGQSGGQGTSGMEAMATSMAHQIMRWWNCGYGGHGRDIKTRSFLGGWGKARRTPCNRTWHVVFYSSILMNQHAKLLRVPEKRWKSAKSSSLIGPKGNTLSSLSCWRHNIRVVVLVLISWTRRPGRKTMSYIWPSIPFRKQYRSYDT